MCNHMFLNQMEYHGNVVIYECDSCGETIISVERGMFIEMTEDDFVNAEKAVALLQRIKELCEQPESDTLSRISAMVRRLNHE